MLADAPLAEEDLDKQVVPGCSCTLFCFADEWLTSSSQEQIAAARLARRPLLPTGVAEAFETGGLEGKAAFSSDGIGTKWELSDTSSVLSLSQWRRCSASFCIRVLTEEAAEASDLEFSPLPVLSSDSEAVTESLTAAGTRGFVCRGAGLGEQGFAASTGSLFSKSGASTSVLSEQRFFDGDGFVQEFSSPPDRGCC